MSTKEPLVVDGELIGWYVTTPTEYMEVTSVCGSIRERVMTRMGGRFFMPVDWKPEGKNESV